MKTNRLSIHVLQAGETIEIEDATVSLREGALLLREPALWLADSMYQPAPRRLTGPASEHLEGARYVTAIEPSQFLVEQPEGVLTRWGAALASVLRRRVPAPSYRARAARA